jgi:uncharacterized protein with GYD domain
MLDYEALMSKLTRREFMSVSAAAGLAMAQGGPARRMLGTADPADIDHRRDDSEGGGPMPFYLTRFSYTPATWAKLIRNPEDRRAAAKQYIEAVGGKLHGFWYAFGDHDGYNLWEAPDNVSMAATALAIGAGGALSSIQTTVLLTVEETLAALRKASSIKYRPPGEQ